MALTFSITILPDLVRVDLSGTRDEGTVTQEMTGVWLRVLERCRATGLKRVLSVSRASGAISASRIRDIANAVPTQLAEVRVAHVVLNDPEAYRANLLGGTVAANRGINIRVFDNETAALAWLRGP